MVTHELLMIDLHKLARLNICERIGDAWVWVAPRPKRQLNVTADAPKAAEDAPTVDAGVRDDWMAEVTITDAVKILSVEKIEVVEVSQVKFYSISTDTMSITEMNELKDNVIADDVKIEVDLKPAHPSFSKVTIDDGNTKSVVADAPLKDRVTTKEKHVVVA
nr:apoptotic chromatin condensation inducer in the nucleus-like isoform X1 [Tanacetum cinerariifolium]